jgi:hypothetical protein
MSTLQARSPRRAGSPNLGGNSMALPRRIALGVFAALSTAVLVSMPAVHTVLGGIALNAID